MNPQEIAQYLLDHPGFFEEHAELLGTIRLTSPVMGRAISLQERQMEIVREKYRSLELRLAELMRIAHTNETLANKFQSWVQQLLLARNDVDLPHVLTQGLCTLFDLPHATMRLWGVAAPYAHAWFAEPVSEDARLFARGLNAPFCGENRDFEAARWLDVGAVRSVALLPLRDATLGTFGLLVLGSPDPARYTPEMATDFLVHIADTSSAALAGLLA